MALSAGSVSVSAYPGASSSPPTTGSEVVVSSGMAGAIYTALIATDSYSIPDWPVKGQVYPLGSTSSDIYGNSPSPLTVSEWEDLVPSISDARVGVLQAAADIANAVASAVIAHIQANAVATVYIETTDSALQRDPATSNNTLGPSAKRTIYGDVT